MKKLYSIALAALTAMSASAAANDWVTVENFENSAAVPDLYNYMGDTPTGKATIVTVATEANADNKAAKFDGGDYNTGLLVTINLPAGKTIADYKAVDFDIYNYDMTYKSIFVYLDGVAVREPSKDNNDVGGDQDKARWKHFQYDLAGTSTATTVKLAVGFKIKSGNSFALDNIRLQEKGEAVAPGTYDETKVGTVTDGWLMLQDYQGKAPGDNVTMWGRYGSPAGTAAVAADPANAKNLMATFEGGDYNTYFEVKVELPQGKTLKNYKTLAFDLYRFTDDDDYKKMDVWAGEAVIVNESDYVQQAPAEKWTTKKYVIPEDIEAGASFMLHFGISSNKAHYAVDNVRLEERATSPNPVELKPTANGTVTDGWLMVNDMQQLGAIDVTIPTWARDESAAEGIALSALDPTDATNLVAAFEGGNYCTVLELPMALPEGKSLKDYGQLRFRIYRLADDDNYKKLRVQADDDVLYLSEDYEEVAPATTWTVKTYDIPASAAAGKDLKLRVGIESDKAHYMIDDVAVAPRTDAIAGITADSEAAAEYFDLGGRRVAADALVPGLYIRRAAGVVTKVIVK